MKKIVLSSLILLFVISVYGQEITRQDYLQKSRNQKTWAYIFTGGGAALALGGLIVLASNADYFPSETVGPILIGGGAAALTGGILLFSSSKKNERKANEMSTAFSLKIEKAEMYRYSQLVNNYYPALSVRVNLR